MSDIVYETFELEDLTVRFKRPTQGQIEAMIRIARSTSAAGDGSDGGFWVRQIGRVGDLLDRLIHPDDLDQVEDLYIQGKIDHVVLLTAVLKVVQASEQAEAGEKVKKAAGARVQRK